MIAGSSGVPLWKYSLLYSSIDLPLMLPLSFFVAFGGTPNERKSQTKESGSTTRSDDVDSQFTTGHGMRLGCS